MLDAVLDELAATLEEIRATIQELDIRLGEAYEAFRERLGHALYWLGYRL
ncbi:MAG: hypothetical protein PVH80_10860 [Anaerolineae bacterium]|jgi:hypothetical protein